MSVDETETTETDRAASGAASTRGGVPAANAATDPDLAVLTRALATNDTDLLIRYNLARQAGLAFDGDRDYYETLGYERDPDAESYLRRYLRNDIARRIVDAPVTASWAERPRVVDDAEVGDEDDAETEFEQAVEHLFDEHRLLHYLKRADKLTGIGEYGLLFLGLADDDGDTTLADPANESDYRPLTETMSDEGPDDLGYLATFSQARVVEINKVSDPLDPRYGLPETYEVEFDDDERGSREVHYTRMIHIAEDLLENEIYGRPRLEPVLNRLDDLEKVLGGSAEMFWRGADRKLHLNYTGEGRPSDMGDLGDEAEEMNHGLRNVLKSRNTEINEIGGQAVDPTGIVEQELKHVAGTVGQPLRMLTGSERGELASTQDRATWYERIEERREQFCEPRMLRAFLDRLLSLGILPDPQGETYSIEWPDLFSLNELEQAELRAKDAETLKKAAPMGDPAQLATVAEIREQVFDWGGKRGSESTTPEDDGATRPDATPPDEGDGPPQGEDGEGGDAAPESEDDADLDDLLEGRADASALVEQARADGD
jgi:hypothetical protein